MKVLEERLVYLFTLFCKDLLCSCFHFGSRTFICMFNIFVFPPPLTCCVFFWGLCSCDLFLYHHSFDIDAFDMHAGFPVDDKVIIQIYAHIVCNLWQDSDQLVELHHKRSLALRVYICSSGSSLQIGDDLSQLFGNVSTSPRWGPMDLSFRIIRDVCDSIFRLSSQGGSAVVLAVFGLWWISLQHPLDFRSSNLDQICAINVCESHIGLRSRALLFSDDQHFSVSLQDISRGVCGVFQPLFDCYSWSDSCTSRMGGLCHLDKWFRTIGPCVFWFRIWHIQQMKKSDDCEDSDREHLNGCTCNGLFYWTELGI